MIIMIMMMPMISMLMTLKMAIMTMTMEVGKALHEHIRAEHRKTFQNNTYEKCIGTDLRPVQI